MMKLQRLALCSLLLLGAFSPLLAPTSRELTEDVLINKTRSFLAKQTFAGGVSLYVAADCSLTSLNCAAGDVCLDNLGGSGIARLFQCDPAADGGLGNFIAPTNLGAGGGSPINALYLVLAANGTLTDERVWTTGDGLFAVDGGANGTFTVRLQFASGIASPVATDCDVAGEYGRAYIDTDDGAAGRVWLCLGAGGWADFGNSIRITSRANLPAAIAYEDEANTFASLQSFNGGIALAGGRPGSQVVEVCKVGCQFSDPQLAVNSITDASAAKPYTVLVYPGVYDVDRMVNKGALTGTISVTNGVTAVSGTDTLFTTELAVGEFIKLGAHADSAFSHIAAITNNTNLTLTTSGVGQFRLGTAPYPQNGYLGATGSGAASRGWAYCPGIDMTGSDATPDAFGCGSVGAGGRDYISLVGVDRRGTIIQRERAAGVLTATIQGSTHMKVENLTLYSPATRTIHWDTWGSLDLNRVDFKTCQPGIGCASGGISSGSGTITADLHTYINITDNFVESGSFSIHGGPCGTSGVVRAWFIGNTFGAFGTAIALDLTGNDSDCTWEIMVAGSVQRYFNVDAGGGFILDLPTDATARAKTHVYTDGSLRVGSNAATAGTTFYNAFEYPVERPPVQDPVGGHFSGDLLVYSPTSQTVGDTTTANAQWPAVVINQGDNSGGAGWWPRLATGDYAAVFIAAGTAVALGDILVTSTTAKDATVNNGQADLTRILGWAESTKSAGVRSLVNVRLNKAAGAVGSTWGTLQTFSGGLTIPVTDTALAAQGRVRVASTGTGSYYYDTAQRQHAITGSDIANSQAGSCTFAAGVSCAVTLPVTEADASYLVVVSCSDSRIFWSDTKLTTGFTINASASTSGVCDWRLIR
jgi:hypothetical protein